MIRSPETACNPNLGRSTIAQPSLNVARTFLTNNTRVRMFPKGSRMSTIVLDSITCVELQDSVTHDETDVRINGVRVAGPFAIRKKQTVPLGGLTRTFTGNVNVQLYEIDSNSADDHLGSVLVGASPVTNNTLEFKAANKAFYTMKYSVI
jgi:hypothetical protein